MLQSTVDKIVIEKLESLYPTVRHTLLIICEDNVIYASFIPTNLNLADDGSRVTCVDLEWEICKPTFNLIDKKYGLPTIDLFASHLNKICDRYVSSYKDPF